ncbi:SAM-dependent methyltransferase [Streptomyces sp. DW26H14]|uniref:SAM-dependent methyltransferase n=1 Tax=Streptomyces sp. DW26H14 TaxID=3435395 RepID=UPI00403E0EA4
MTSARPSEPDIDISTPHPARIYDCLLGGDHHFPADRAVAERLPAAARLGARANRAFMRRATAWVAGTGIDQFLDIGSGIPTEPNLHRVAQGVDPRCRVVYADYDPMVLRYAEELLAGTPEGRTEFVRADVREPAAILERARAVLDFDRPVALSLIALLHFVPDSDDPYGLVRALLDALAPGSCLVLSHLTMDLFTPEEDRTADYRSSGIDLRPRTRAEVSRFFDGLDLVDPGLATGWHRDAQPPADTEPEGARTAWSGVGFLR